MDAVADAVRLQMLQHFVDAFPVLVFAGVHGDAEACLARLLE